MRLVIVKQTGVYGHNELRQTGGGWVCECGAAATRGGLTTGRAMCSTQTQRPASGSSDPVVYSYDDGEHCPACAAAVFGVDEWGHVYGVDKNGNEVRSVAPWEHHETTICDTCGNEID